MFAQAVPGYQVLRILVWTIYAVDTYYGISKYAHATYFANKCFCSEPFGTFRFCSSEINIISELNTNGLLKRFSHATDVDAEGRDSCVNLNPHEKLKYASQHGTINANETLSGILAEGNQGKNSGLLF